MRVNITAQDMYQKDGRDLEWQDRARCVGMDPDLFFPDRGVATRPAKNVCTQCPVREDCLEYALAGGEKFGIWGGTSERERRKMRRVRAVDRERSRRMTRSGSELNAAQVDEIAAQAGLPGVFQADVAAAHGISRETVNRIVNGRTWGELT